jgi:hypothetical protein
MPVEPVSRCKYGFILMDDYSRASWVLFLRAKSDAPVEFEKWVRRMQNGTGRTIKTVMFDNARELVAGRMREFCDERGIRIVYLVGSILTRVKWNCGREQPPWCSTMGPQLKSGGRGPRCECTETDAS